jgi:hypothetical protein
MFLDVRRIVVDRKLGGGYVLCLVLKVVKLHLFVTVLIGLTAG